MQKQGITIFERYEVDAKQNLGVIGVNSMFIEISVFVILIGIAIDDGLINPETDLICLYFPELELEQYKSPSVNADSLEEIAKLVNEMSLTKKSLQLWKN